MEYYIGEKELGRVEHLQIRVEELERENRYLKEELCVMEQCIEIVAKNSRTTLTRAGKDLRLQQIINPHVDYSGEVRDKQLCELKGGAFLEKYQKIKEDVISKGTPQRLEIEANLSDGLFTYEVLAEHLIDMDGRVIGVLTASTDITEKKKIQQYMVEGERLSTLGQVSANVFHEVKNIMTVIMGSAQLASSKLKRHSFDVQNIEVLLLRIVEQGQKGANVLSNLLSIARGNDAGKKFVDVCELIDVVVELQKHQFYLEGIELVKDFKKVPKILGHAELLEQVFLNLLINARHAMEAQGRGKITIAVQEVSGLIEIRFEDTGPGIKSEIRDKIFTPFFTTKAGSGTISNGSGLGLAIVAQTIKNHNGTVEVESEEGLGAIFTIKLPVKEQL